MGRRDRLSADRTRWRSQTFWLRVFPDIGAPSGNRGSGNRGSGNRGPVRIRDRSPEASRGTVGDMSTRMLILSALVCGMGLLVAFTVQVVMAL